MLQTIEALAMYFWYLSAAITLLMIPVLGIVAFLSIEQKIEGHFRDE